MVVAGEQDKTSSTMLWVQAATLQQIHNTAVQQPEWFYIPRPSLTSAPSSLPHGRPAGRRSSEGGSDSRRTLPSPHELPQQQQPVSSASSASSQLSGSSGQPLVSVERRPSWLPEHPPPLQVLPKDKQDPEMGRSDGDNVSLASSTHFTVVGGGRAPRGGGSGCGCCSHSHRLTALVLTMSLIFLAGITAAVVLLEMRVHHRR